MDAFIPRKILHLVSTATMTGAADPALELARSQRLLGHDARIAYDRHRAGNMPDKVRQLQVPDVPELSLCTKGGPRLTLRTMMALRRWSAQVDIVHCHMSHDHGLAALCRKRALLVRSIHHPRSVQRRAFQGVAYHRTDGFTFVADAHRQAFLSHYPRISQDCTAVVPAAVDVQRFHPSADGQSIREELGIPGDAFVVGMVARFQPGRRQIQLIEAFARAREQTGANLWLAFIGKGETRLDILASLAKHGVENVSRLYGFRDDDLPQAIASCDVTVLLKEGSDAGCRAVLQSLACGVPVVGADYAAIVDAVDPPNCGTIVPANDVLALTEALVQISQTDRTALVHNARRRMVQSFTDASRVRTVEDFYEGLATLNPGVDRVATAG